MGGGADDVCRRTWWSQEKTKKEAQLMHPIHMRIKVWSLIGKSILKDSRKALEGEDIKQGTLTSTDQPLNRPSRVYSQWPNSKAQSNWVEEKVDVGRTLWSSPCVTVLSCLADGGNGLALSRSKWGTNRKTLSRCCTAYRMYIGVCIYTIVHMLTLTTRHAPFRCISALPICKLQEQVHTHTYGEPSIVCTCI